MKLVVEFDGKNLRILAGEHHVTVRRIVMSQGPHDKKPVIDIEQYIFSEAGRAARDALRAIPGINLVPMFMNPDGAIVEETEWVPKAATSPTPVPSGPDTEPPRALSKRGKK